MHAGVYIGERFNAQEHRLLILGESHHGTEEEKGKEASYTSEGVVNAYLSAKRGTTKMNSTWKFFTKIAHMFDSSFNCEQTIDFWEKVAFGNYIDVSCGVKDGFAQDYVEKASVKENLNKDLFQFVNENEIDCILCVSPLVFSCLPEIEQAKPVKEETYFMMMKYAPKNTIKGVCMLKKTLQVYCTNHPSSYGFKPSLYNDILGGKI